MKKNEKKNEKKRKKTFILNSLILLNFILL